MPFIERGGCRVYWRLEGRDDRPVLVLSHALGLDHGMWSPQAADLQAHFRVLRYDTRGHGASGTSPGDCSIEQLGRDALAVADAAGASTFAFCGLSLGGMIGQWVAAHAPERLTHLVLANTSPRLTDPALMEARRRAALEGGMAAVADMAMARFFSPGTLAVRPAPVDWARRTLLASDPVGYAGCCAAIRDMDHVPLLAHVRVPTLVIGGDLDVAMPWEAHGAVLAGAIPSARVARLPAAHISNLERPRTFTAALLDFLLPPSADPVGDGMRMRRALLGDAHVDRNLAAASDFTREFQELITRFAWGAIWTRPGLDERTRRLLVLTATAAMGRWEEFTLHVRAGLGAELEPCDLKEVLLQLAVYAGVPAANTAFQIAAQELTAAGRPPAAP